MELNPNIHLRPHRVIRVALTADDDAVPVLQKNGRARDRLKPAPQELEASARESVAAIRRLRGER